MNRPRVIPMLLLGDGGLIKTVRFDKRRYVGDPINAVRIFNDKEVDELVLLDVDATRQGREPNYAEVEEILSEAFMPVGYGGGIRTMQHIEKLFTLGVEKVVLNSVLAETPGLLAEASAAYGAQSIVASLDVKKDLFGRYRAFSHSGTRKYKEDPLELLAQWERLGAGELVVNSIDRDGTRQGMDVEFIGRAAAASTVPVLAVGGAGSVGHLADALRAGASAVGAGSMFIFHGVHQAVLISYIDHADMSVIETSVTT